MWLNASPAPATSNLVRSTHICDHSLAFTTFGCLVIMAKLSLLPSAQHLSLERRSNNIFLLTLHRAPENRLNSGLCQEIIQALHHVQRILTSEGPDAPGALITTSFSEKFFCTGLDLDEPDTNPWAMTDGFYPMLAAFLDFPYPTVACITGHTFGGGGPLSLAHDYRVMNDQKGFFCMVSPAIAPLLSQRW